MAKDENSSNSNIYLNFVYYAFCEFISTIFTFIINSALTIFGKIYVDV